jgi:glycosyltransferase involved in cell wall biosynthesis
MNQNAECAAPTPAGKVLLVSWGLSPWRAGSAVVVENLAAQFRADEMVLAGQRPVDWKPSLSRPTGPRTYHISREWTWPRRGRRFVHWVRWLLLPVVVWRLVRVIRRERCDTVLAVFPNEFYLLAAYLAAKATKTRFLPYYHNTYLENRRGLARWFATWLQARTFLADTVFVMSAGMRDFYEQRYPGTRFVPLVHAFNEEVHEAPPATLHSPLRLVYLGHLNESNLDASLRFAELIRSRPECTLTIYSASPTWYLEKVGVAGPRIRFAGVSGDRITTELQDYDIFLLPHGFHGPLSDVEYATIFPTRTIPYLLAGRPILAHSPKDAFLTKWLREHQCAEIVDEPSVEKLSNALDRLVSNRFRREELVRNGYRAVRQFHAPIVVQILRDVIQEGRDETGSQQSADTQIPIGA